MLVAYLQHVNPSIETGVLLITNDEGSSKKSKKSKKVSEEVVIQENPKKQSKIKSPKKIAVETETPKEKVVAESSKEFIPSKSGVFKRLRNFTYQKRTSSTNQSPTVRKPQLNKKGVKVREISAPVSPSSKKRRAEDVAKHINKKMKKRNLVVQDES
ncbi:unnamed protein product [Lactuca saligna]|uniref:Uncharacterized protein n=1 Tax=Lactuca saligna TaxID=75948 RepID=A0AA35VEC6_LACSI|nr:unnamed protein product [Lactuca saligna]